MIIPENYFIYISISIVLIYLSLMIIGYLKGFLYEIVSLVYTGISILISWFVAPIFASSFPVIKLENLYPDATLLQKFINLDPILNTALYFIVVFFVLKLFYIVLALVLKSINKIPVVGKLNKILGILMGVFNATIITLILSALLMLPIFKNGKEVKENTVFKYINTYTEKVLTFVVDNVELDNIKKQFSNFDVDSAREEFKTWIETLS